MTQDPIIRGMLQRRKDLDAISDRPISPLESVVDLGIVINQLREAHIEKIYPVARQHYLTIMAMCYRALRDQGLQTKEDSESKE